MTLNEACAALSDEADRIVRASMAVAENGRSAGHGQSYLAEKTRRDAEGVPSRILSGIRPSGSVHLGHWVGVILPLVKRAAAYPGHVFIEIADLHALASGMGAAQIREASLDLVAGFLAAGVRPEQAHVFRQSYVTEINQIFTILSTWCNLSPALDRNPGRQRESETQSWIYPALMAADIIAVRANRLIVGPDQVANVHRCAEIINTLNRRADKCVAVVPKADVTLQETVPGIDGQKMDSKKKNEIPVFGDWRRAADQIRQIRTDSRRNGEPLDPDNCIVFRLFASFADATAIARLREEYVGGSIGYSDAKSRLATGMLTSLGQVRARYATLRNASDELEDILHDGERRVREEAHRAKMLLRNALAF